MPANVNRRGTIMPLDTMHRHTRSLIADMKRFELDLEEIIRYCGCGEEPACLIERHMSSELDYDLVFRDAAGNVIGIQVGAEEGPSVLMKTNTGFAPEIISGIAAQVYAGHILGGRGILRAGTVIAACSCAEGPSLEKAARVLFEDSLPRLGIGPGLAIITAPSDGCVSAGKGRDWRVLDAGICGPGPCGNTANAPCLEDAVFAMAALAYRYLLSRQDAF
jgi:hypothetical protein